MSIKTDINSYIDDDSKKFLTDRYLDALLYEVKDDGRTPDKINESYTE